jgi:hypothetical protein
MFKLDVLRYQTLILALLGGISLLLFVVVAYLDYWKPRKKKPDTNETMKEWMNWWEAIPWSLKITYVGSIIFAVLYTIYSIYNPPTY